MGSGVDAGAWRVVMLVPRLVTGCKIWHLRPQSTFFTKAAWHEAICSIPSGSQAVVVCVPVVPGQELGSNRFNPLPVPLAINAFSKFLLLLEVEEARFCIRLQSQLNVQPSMGPIF